MTQPANAPDSYAIAEPPGPAELSALAAEARAWPFEEARKLALRFQSQPPEKGHVLFETGYGPSGLPHLGTFGEVARTSMVRRAFAALRPDIPTRLVCVSDDMDGLRKVPSNIPNQEAMQAHLGMPLSRIPDPFGVDPSFAHHNNRRLREFLDSFGFEYQFISASDAYAAGKFDETLLRVLEQYDKIMAVMLPTLGDERRASYSPFLPISPTSGQVLQVPLLERDPARGTIVFEDSDGRHQEVPVTGGHCKLQWKIDWPMRWVQLGVDYEMYGKDLIDSAKIGQRIVKILGGRMPEGFAYEHFLDAEGQKISKSKGNGLSIEEWLTYAPHESLALYNFLKPRSAKRLHFAVIPKAVDDYLTWRDKYADDLAAKRLENPAWHIHGDAVPPTEAGLNFTLLLNLVAVANSEDAEALWGFIRNYAPELTAEQAPMLDRLVTYALRYYRDFVEPAKAYRQASPPEAEALQTLASRLAALPSDADAETIQSEVYATGLAAGYSHKTLKLWFQALYQVLLGQDQGPRFGSFAKLYGLDKTVALINRQLADSDAG